MIKNLPAIFGSGRSTGEGNGYPLQYSCLENSMERGAWQATVHGVGELDMTERLSLNFIKLLHICTVKKINCRNHFYYITFL